MRVGNTPIRAGLCEAGQAYSCKTGAFRIHAANRLGAFSLIEVIVVLAIMAVAAGLIVPRIGGSIGRRELRESAARFAHTARTVRELAVARQQVCALEIDLDRRIWGVSLQSGSDGSGRLQAVQTSWLKAGRWPETVSVGHYGTPDGKTMTAGTQQLKFYPDGTSSGGSLRLVCGTDEFDVVVHPHSGRVVYGHTKTSDFTPDQYDLGD